MRWNVITFHCCGSIVPDAATVDAPGLSVTQTCHSIPWLQQSPPLLRMEKSATWLAGTRRSKIIPFHGNSLVLAVSAAPELVYRTKSAHRQSSASRNGWTLA